IGGLLGDKAVSSVFDNSKIKRLVPEFNAKLSFAEGIRRSVEWFEARPEKCTIDAEWNNWSDTVIAAYEKGFNRS
ncbi:NAD-dependent dehydratase, partial [Paenibacillus sepulcri]|nr:NAD-dependent dehydratase [Paenibacillus sepulcri]